MNNKILLIGVMILGLAGGVYFSFFQPVDGVYVSTSNPIKIAIDKKYLKLGDDAISTEPKRGFIYSCQTSFNKNAPGAMKEGPWISYGYRDPTKKITVDGRTIRTKASYNTTYKGTMRVITSNGLPLDSPTGNFPIDPSDDAYEYDRNPNSVQKQNISIMIPKVPTIAESPSCVGMGMIGITVTGVPIFNGLDAGGRDAVAHEIQDICSGHPEKQGQYHYHSMSACFEDTTEKGKHSALYGYAMDGFGIYGPKGEKGEILSNADLGACHGHEHIIMWDGKERTMYHYHTTAEYPYTVGCFRGTPVITQKGLDIVNEDVGQKLQPSPVGTSHTPPFRACEGKKLGDKCIFIGKGGESISDTCRSIDIGLVCGGIK